MDARVQKLGQLVVNYSVTVRPGNWVVIRAPIDGVPLAEACVEAVLQAGAHPSAQIGSGRLAEAFLRHANDEQLQFVAPTQKVAIEQADVLISILAPSNTRELSGIDPHKMALQQKAGEPLTRTYMDRWAKGELDWTITQFPTEAAAQDAGMSLHDYEEFVYGAALLDRPDPVAAWRELGERQQRLIEWLGDKSEIHITGSGTDLTVNVGGRSWESDDGRGNFPGGEVYTGPNETATEGTIRFNYPAVYHGREINGIRLTFKGGEVVDAAASADEAYLHEMLSMDDGARRLGEFAFGTNPGIQQFSRNTLFDEKIGGTLHMALGKSIPNTGGINESALHWDIVYNLREGAEVTVDGQPFSKNGQFCV